MRFHLLSRWCPVINKCIVQSGACTYCINTQFMLEEHSSFDRGYRCWSFLTKLPSVFLGEKLVRQCWWIAVDIILDRIHSRCLLLDRIVISRWAISASIGSFLWASASFPGYGGPSSLFLRRFSNGGRGTARFFSCSVYYRSLLVSWLEGYGFNP